MHDYQLLHNSLVLSGLLFALGAIGFACRRDLVIVLLSAGMMLQASVMSLAAYGRFYGDPTGQTFGLFALAVASIFALVAMAVSVFVIKREGSLDLARWRRLGQSGPVEKSERPLFAGADATTDATAAETRQPNSSQAAAPKLHNDHESAGGADG